MSFSPATVRAGLREEDGWFMHSRFLLLLLLLRLRLSQRQASGGPVSGRQWVPAILTSPVSSSRVAVGLWAVPGVLPTVWEAWLWPAGYREAPALHLFAPGAGRAGYGFRQENRGSGLGAPASEQVVQGSGFSPVLL